jgi:hypothetical protein
MNEFQIKTSKVTTAKYDGKWQELHKYHIEFENGDKGTYFSKSEDQQKFKAGIETTYKYDELKNRVKPHWEGAPQSQGSKPTYSAPTSDRELSIIRQSSLKVSLDYIAIKGGDLHEIIDTAEILTEWVQTGKKPQKTESNDLPF